MEEVMSGGHWLQNRCLRAAAWADEGTAKRMSHGREDFKCYAMHLNSADSRKCTRG